jgi:two-component system, cell cycle response regulator CpdR
MAQALTILFVDDDQQVRAVIAEALAAKGFRVLAADSGYEAMQLLAQEHIDVLFADIVMPGLNGIDLAKQAKALHPDLRVILATAYYSRAEEAKSVGKLLFKPLRADEIEAEILNLMA